MANLEVSFLGKRLSSFIIVGSAGITDTVDKMMRAEDHGAGAVIAKGLSDLALMRKSPSPRFSLLQRNLANMKSTTLYSYEQAAGLGPEEYAKELARAKERLSIPVFANVDCLDQENWTDYIRCVQDAGIDGIEVNVSCPHGSLSFLGGSVETELVEVVCAIQDVATVPLIVKLSPQLTSPLQVVQSLHDVGARAVTLFNRFTGLEIDINSKASIMHGGYAGFGGMWSLHYGLRWISLISPQIPVEISASGGVSGFEDVVKYILAGAGTVQVCSAIYLQGYSIISKITADLKRYMEKEKIGNLEEIRGMVCDRIKGMDQVDRTTCYEPYIDQDRCTGCGICISRCIHRGLDGSGGSVAPNDHCVNCGLCVALCPHGAITMRKSL
ncbi:MAG: 4Fe-4S binding protein [Limnochordia bacterium]|nr:4Fe-4S binding protein [Limnochordia bacterium]